MSFAPADEQDRKSMVEHTHHQELPEVAPVHLWPADDPEYAEPQEGNPGPEENEHGRTDLAKCQFDPKKGRTPNQPEADELDPVLKAQNLCPSNSSSHFLARMPSAAEKPVSLPSLAITR